MKHHESIEQRAVIRWANLSKGKSPALSLLVAIPNGGKRSRIEAAIMKGEGVRAGFPDLVLFHAAKGFHGLAIEMKRKDGGTVSPAQKEWITALNEEGYKAVVCHGAEEAIETLRGYLK